MVTAVAMLTTLLSVVNVPAASAAGTVLFDNDFDNKSVDGTGTVTKPDPASGTNTACLTAKGNSATLPLLSCPGASDAQGAGKLRLTNSGTNLIGAVFGATSFPTTAGLDVTFQTYQWGGGGADGMAFLLAAVDPDNPASPGTIGPSGGSLGYSPAGSVQGLANGYLGVGLDVYGNFSSTGFQGTGCPDVPTIRDRTPGAVVVRGPGNRLAGYCGLTTTWDGTAGSKATLRGTTRLATVPVQVLINPTGASFISDSGVTVAAGTYKVVVRPFLQAQKTLTGPLPTVPSGLYPAQSWLSANGVPKQLAFGFVGSTGSVTDSHEISDVTVKTFTPVPQLTVASTSYSTPNPQPGDPVNYTVTSGVRVGADETKPISVTQTVPAGVVPVGAYGTGWICENPVDRTVTCTTSGSSFADGTTLPNISVIGIVTGANVTSTIIQNASTVRASSADANPGVDTKAGAGTLPTTPSGFTVSPAFGPIAAGNRVTATFTSSVAPTAIEIGTAAEQRAGTPVVLLPCVGANTTKCFSVSGNTIVIASMPPRASAANTTITLVTLGVAAQSNYVYADKPATPEAPTTTAGTTSVTLAWKAPADNGSPLTGYVVTPYLSGVAQTAVPFDASVTTRTLTGLTKGGSYTFTVAATNALGTSTPSPRSSEAVPYGLPDAPAINALTVGSQAATLTWTTPNNNGSAITNYVVTPYIGTVAQTPQTFTGGATTQTLTGLTAGTAYTFTVAARNAAGIGPPSVRSSSVTPNQSPSLTFPAPPAGEVGAAYSTALTVTNGTSPFVWSVSNGTLPDGLKLNAATGLLSGSPTEAGTFAITVRVVDASNQSATKTITLTVVAAPTLSFTPSPGEVSVSYSQQPTLTGGTGPFTWAVDAGNLPAGLKLNPSTGLLSGTPATAGQFLITISATDALQQVAAKTVTLLIVALPTFNATAPRAGQVGVIYTDTYDVTGGSKPLTWSVPAGNLPPGLTLSPQTGTLTGIPTTEGSYPFTVAVIDANNQTATRTVTVIVGPGPLQITKTANVTSTAPGGEVSYTITIKNTGNTTWTEAALTDSLTGVLDDAVYQNNATASRGTLNYSAATLNWSGNIPAGSAVTITYSVSVSNPGTGNKVLSNTVTSPTLGTNCPSGTASPPCTATVTVSGLTIVKTADTTTTTPGSTVHFKIVMTNTGRTPLVKANLTDSLAGLLDDAKYNDDANVSSGNLTYSSPVLTWNGSLAVGASSTITYSVKVDDPDPGDKTLTGTAVSSSPGSSCPQGNGAPTCTATVTVLIPGLAIVNLVDADIGDTTTPGSTVPYTVTVSNTGQTVYNDSIVTINLSGALDDATYDDNAASTLGKVNFDAANGTITWTGDLAVGAVVTITGSVTVRDPDPGNRSLTTRVTSSVPGSSCPAVNTNPLCKTDVQVRVPQLTITKSSDVASTTPGSIVRYTTTVTNSGQTPYTSATLTDSLAGALDDATYNADAATTTGKLNFTEQTLIWTGALPVGGSATITYSLTVNQPTTGDRTLSSAVVSPAPGNNCPTTSTDPRCSSALPVLIPGLTIVTADDAPSAGVAPGDVVHYTFTVTNSGQSTYQGLAVNVNLAEARDDAFYNSDAAITAGNLETLPSGNFTWSLNLAAGATASATLSMRVKEQVSGDKSLRVRASSDAPGSNCPALSNDSACNSSVQVLVPGLTITKAANASTVIPGETVDYTITVINDGESALPVANFRDSLDAVLTDGAYNADATASTGTVVYNAPVLTWTGSLSPGASATITYSVTVFDPDPGDKLLFNTVVSTSPGNNCPAGGMDSRCTSSVYVTVPNLTIKQTADQPTTSAKRSVTFTISVTNSGETPYVGATFNNSLTGVMDDAAFNDDATASEGITSVEGTTLTWTGDLAVGATATITYSATVRQDSDGDHLLISKATSTTLGSNCTPDSSDSRCTSIVSVASLVIEQHYTEATTTPGSLIHLTATFTNTGKVPYTGITISSPNADTIDDALPTGDQTATSGTLILNATNITWTGNIPVGDTITITGTLTVKDPTPGNKIITGTLQSTAPGNNCPTDSTEVPLRSRTVAPLGWAY